MQPTLKSPFVLLLAGLISIAFKAVQDDFTIIKGRVVEELMQPGTNDERVWMLPISI